MIDDRPESESGAPSERESGRDEGAEPARITDSVQTATVGWPAPAGEPAAAAPSHPSQIGRFQIQRPLGMGSFGSVYLARDPDLDRDVALKVPRRERFSGDADIERFMNEARAAARLKHPGIVTVHDVGREGDLPFVVLEYVEGQDLANALAKRSLTPVRAAQIMAQIADAVGYAHQQGLIHRDLKPANVLLDARGWPRVTDFGLAIFEGNRPLKAGEVAGTPGYMAPEQVRGESHRLDGRTDIWALGAMLYEMLTHRRPFRGSSRAEVFEEIEYREPKPPRQSFPEVPRELERICLKCLAKRMADRYATAGDLADDLRDWMTADAGCTGSASAASTAAAAGTAAAESRVVPKGLRSFDRDDADFFLDLLPGPRGRHGLPDSLHVWKTRIEQTDPDETFAVGLLYGPSGCGKSSLVQAGLLPRLGSHVLPLYVEAAPGKTEARLVRELRKRCPEMPRDLTLPDAIAGLRQGRWAPEGAKLLIVFDQFEQWLHARGGDFQGELLAALRQCDGRRVQCLILVRDDFWVAVSRFFTELELDLVPGRNAALADLFDPLHARKVLAKFGCAYGRLPGDVDALTPEQAAFLDGAIRELSHDGKVIAVHLALVAEMLKGKPWTAATLKELGGTAGVGVVFLEETFSSPTANPKHRWHQRAARRVLQSLLPGAGSDLKGHTRSYDELLAASGYAAGSREFEELIRILDSEVRLLTPTESAGAEEDEAAVPTQSPAGVKVYELTHDFLVPALRQWLTRKQQETRRGRAQLRLAERAARWSGDRETKQLPTLTESVRIWTLTEHARWSAPEREMMRQAGRVHAVRLLAAAAVVFALGAWGQVQQTRVREAVRARHVSGLVEQLKVADIERVPEVVAAMEPHRDLWQTPLAKVAADEQASEAERLRAGVALVSVAEPAQRSEILNLLVRCGLRGDSSALGLVRDRLEPYRNELAVELWQNALDARAPDPVRLRAGAFLAAFDPEDARWQQLATPVGFALLGENPWELDRWAALLQPASASEIPVLRAVFSDPDAKPPDRLNAARILAQWADAALLAELLLQADATQYSLLIQRARSAPDEVLPQLLAEVQPGAATGPHPATLVTAHRVRNAAVTLLHLGRPQAVWPLLGGSPDPTARTALLLHMHEFGVPVERLLEGLPAQDDPAVRQGLLLALEPYHGPGLAAPLERAIVDLCTRSLEQGEFQAERSAARWLLCRWGQADRVREIEDKLERVPDGDWQTTREGHTLRIVRGPVTFGMGSADDEPGREGEEVRRTVTIERSFAVAIHETTIEQFRRFQADAEYATDVSPDNRCPMNRISWLQAVRYCRWLSEQEGLPEEQMCYPPLDQITPAWVVTDQLVSRSGYRLPTEAEWEFVCRAGAETRWCCGISEAHLPQFAWFAHDSQEHLWPVGLLRPNLLGLFDIHGNVGEWCHLEPAVEGLYDGLPAGYVVGLNGEPSGATRQAFRGGSYQNTPKRLRSAQRFFLPVGDRNSFFGFRIARTLPD